MTADNGALQTETMDLAMRVVSAHVAGDDALLRQTVREVRDALEVRGTDVDDARTFVYIYQAARLTELALDLAAAALGKPKEEVLQALAGSIALLGFED